MVLRMPSPTKRPGSDNWYFRRRIPKEVQAILAKLPASQRPRGWFKTEAMISLGTADRVKAKAKCPEVAAEFERTLTALKTGPKGLTPKQIAALSGELYKAFAEGLEENPVATAEQWQRVAALNEYARLGRYGRKAKLGIFRSEEERREASMEARFGKMVDAFLRQRSILTTDDSRFALIERASLDLSEAAQKLARNADGDFSLDEYVKRFPAFEQDGRKPAKSSLTALVQEWHEAALNRGVRKRDADRIKSRFEKLIVFLKHDNTRRVTKLDIVQWRDSRLAQRTSIKTINASDIASFTNVFNWGVERNWLEQNPAAKMTIKTNGRKRKLRDEFFSPEEVAIILNHSATVSGAARESPKTTAAKRWVPWLLAYSGARAAEMIQIRKKDVRKDRRHGWILRLDPEAGSIKTDHFCDVPIHEHLIAEGFLDFVASSEDGHLFCQPKNDGTVLGPVTGVYSRIRMMVREVMKENVQPNHAWRYTFKTYGFEAGIQEMTLDAISNHAPKHQGGKYTKVTLKTRAEAIARFPRYDLTG